MVIKGSNHATWTILSSQLINAKFNNLGKPATTVPIEDLLFKVGYQLPPFHLTVEVCFQKWIIVDRCQQNWNLGSAIRTTKHKKLFARKQMHRLKEVTHDKIKWKILEVTQEALNKPMHRQKKGYISSNEIHI